MAMAHTAHTLFTGVELLARSIWTMASTCQITNSVLIAVPGVEGDMIRHV